MADPRDMSRSVVDLIKECRDKQEQHDKRVPVQLSIRDKEGELLDELYDRKVK